MGKLLGIKPTDKEIRKYCEDIEDLYDLDQTKESAVVPKFESLLSHCAKKVGWLLSSEYVISRIGKRPDGAFLDEFSYSQGIMEAKDDDDDLEDEVKNKFAIGYPRNNTIFWQPNRIIIYQNNKKVFDVQVGRIKKDLLGKKIEHTAESRSNLAQALNMFFEFEPPHYEQWLEAVDAFKQAVPELSAGLLEKINQAKKDNNKFKDAFANFREVCRQSINPNISDTAIEEMIIQHLLTERLLRKVFDLDRFTQDNTIAHQLEEVIASLTSESFNRKEFLGRLDGFYKSIEAVAEDIEDFSEKQTFINAIYEKFFQGWAVKSADTLGIVYTPQPVVEFMVKSVEEILKAEFGKSLSSPNVHILDPFVGTGNFIVRVMKQIQPTDLQAKYRAELHCNEIALMPYYIASMNIEHEYWAVNKKYEPFTGICFADTFQMFEDAHYLGFAQAENSERVKKQIEKPIFVVITNPPYNSNQANENDNNKNRKYEKLEKEVSLTYSRDSKATNTKNLADPYVKAIKWASKRIGEEGVVAVITNNSFIDNFAFDGMRKHLSLDFDKIYVLDLGGNIRKNPKLSGTTHNVFGIQVGVSINLLVKKNREKLASLDGRDADQVNSFASLDGRDADQVNSFASLDKGGARRAEGSKSNNENKEPPYPPSQGGLKEIISKGGNEQQMPEGSGVYYARLDEYWRKEQKYEWLAKTGSVYNVAWKKLEPNQQNVWLTEGLAEDFEANIPLADLESSKSTNESLFIQYCLGINTNRDEWVFNFNIDNLKLNMSRFINTYNSELDRWRKGKFDKNTIDNFVNNDDTKIKWSSSLKQHLILGRYAGKEHQIRKAIYRPFSKTNLFFERILIHRPSHFDIIFPTPETESENMVILTPSSGARLPYWSFISNVIPNLTITSLDGTQCFPFYTYNENGTGRRENITDWSLAQFRQHYSFASLDKGGARRAEGSEKDENIEPPYPPSQGGQKEIASQGGLKRFASLDKGGARRAEGSESFNENLKERAKQYGYVWDKGFLPYNPNLLENAKQLRKNMTPAERKLWYEFLKDGEFKFLRQHPIDNYIVDFYCSSLQLVIEVDGESHESKENIENDRQRDDTLTNIYGLTVIRVSNADVMKNFEGVCLMMNERMKNPHISFASLDKGGARRAEGSEYVETQNPPTPLPKGGTKEEITKGGNEEDLAKGGTKEEIHKCGNENEITKWDIFYYVYAMLHHPGYRDEYKENLRRSLPRIPFAPDFWKFAKIGKQLADLHVNYEKVEPYKLETVQNREVFSDVQFKIKKMKLSADKTQLVYNEAITFTGIPREVYEYKLGNRSALEWIVDQYQVTTDPRSGITQDPNDFDGDERYIFNLIGRIVAVSLETVKLTNELATLTYKENP